MYMYGGIIAITSRLSGELWKFDIYNNATINSAVTSTQSVSNGSPLISSDPDISSSLVIASLYSSPESTALPSSESGNQPSSADTGDVPIEIIAESSKTISSKSTMIKPASSGSTTNLFTTRNLIIMIALGILLVLATSIFAFSCRRTSKKSSAPITQDSEGTAYGRNDDSSTTQSANTTSIMTSNYGLAIPGYLLVSYGTSVRSNKEIARGGFGRIMLGEVLDMDTLDPSTPVIIKEMLTRDGEVSQKEIDSFYQEVSIMAYLDKHENIAKLYGYSERPYTIVIKYYPLGSLDGWIYSSQKRKSVFQIFYFGLDIALGVEYIWKKGFCHADLKPQNVLIDQDSSTNVARCVLTDFGITQIFSDKSLLVQAFNPVNINGASLCYAAPEALLKLRKKEFVPPQSLSKFDIYSFAITLFELVCRKKPF